QRDLQADPHAERRARRHLGHRHLRRERGGETCRPSLPFERRRDRRARPHRRDGGLRRSLRAPVPARRGPRSPALPLPRHPPPPPPTPQEGQRATTQKKKSKKRPPHKKKKRGVGGPGGVLHPPPPLPPPPPVPPRPPPPAAPAGFASADEFLAAFAAGVG